jgi:O-antigen/teichoic acid export membrane protein
MSWFARPQTKGLLRSVRTNRPGRRQVGSCRSLRELVRFWYRDELLRRLVKNAGYLVSGNVVAAGLGLVALALTARALGPELLGLLALIEAYAALVDRLLRLEPWQALIKYGADALERERRDDFRDLLKFGVLVDVCGAVVSAGMAAAAVFVVGPWLGWQDETVTMAGIYSLILIVHLSATPIAVLRLFDRFAVFAGLEIATAAARVVVCAIAFAAGAGLWTFVLLAMAVHLGRHATLGIVAWRELRRRGYGDFLKGRVRGIGQSFPGIWGFMLSLKASVTIRRSTGDLDVLLIGALLDPGAVGLYHVAKRFGDATLKVGVPIQQAVFPDTARLWARREIRRLRQAVTQVDLLTGGLAACVLAGVAFNTDLVLRLSVGAEYMDAATLVILQLLATTTALFGTALRPVLLSMGLQILLLKIVIASTLAFYATLALSLPLLGVVGASLAHIVQNALWLLAARFAFARRIRHEARGVAAADWGPGARPAGSAPSGAATRP